MINFFTKNFHLINIPPLFYISLFFVAGIIWHSALILFLGMCLLVSCYASVAYFKNFPIPTQLILCSFFTLYGAWLHEREVRNYNDFYTFIENKKFTVSGTVIDIYEATTHYKKSTVIVVATDTIATENCATTSNKNVLFYTKSNNNIAV